MNQTTHKLELSCKHCGLLTVFVFLFNWENWADIFPGFTETSKEFAEKTLLSMPDKCTHCKRPQDIEVKWQTPKLMNNFMI